MAVFTARWYE